CTNIGWGKGVCGTALAQNKTIIVPDVHKFDGHIACDSASNSEIVVPMYLHDKPIGVLDIDSILLDRFDSSHQELFENIVRHLIQTNGNAISRLVANNE
ncbi:MAG: GAF domain-containing protein, partial [Firmicutes bacterium]|nr:GAF domain-containing protein [Bacillota bacterium]